MTHRPLAILAVLLLALNLAGCRSSANSRYEEVLMPLQTGSVLHRRVQVQSGPEKKSRKKASDKKEKEKPRKSEAEPSATPTPEEESTPAPERFR